MEIRRRKGKEKKILEQYSCVKRTITKNWVRSVKIGGEGGDDERIEERDDVYMQVDLSALLLEKK